MLLFCTEVHTLGYKSSTAKNDFMQYKIYESERLLLNPIQLSDAPFVLELLNTPGWIEFIGDKNIHSLEGAEKYIIQFLENPNALFWWIVTNKENQIPIGTVTLMQRSYLLNPDIGFAFLPEYGKQGFAFEAVNTIAVKIREDNPVKILFAIVLESNINSQNLLKRLGMSYIKNVLSDTKEELMLFSLDPD